MRVQKISPVVMSMVLSLALAVSSGFVQAQQKDEGRAGVPTLGKDKNGRDIVPKTLDDIPKEWCPSSNPYGWDHTNKRPKSWNGWACSQEYLSVSGGGVVDGLFDKAYASNTIAPGAANLSYDYLRALIDTKTRQGKDSGSAWGEVNQISQKLHGQNAKDYQSSSHREYLNYDDPATAMMLDAINRCGCVMQFNVDPDDSDQYLVEQNKMQKGCPGATTVCGGASPNITLDSSVWGPKNVYNKTFMDLAASCVYFWNTLVNNTYNAKNGITDSSDPNYVQVCDPTNTGGSCTICTVSGALKDNNPNLPDKLFCDGSTFVGPGLLSYSGKDRNGGNTFQTNPILVSYDGKNCGENTGKIDIVAQ